MSLRSHGHLRPLATKTLLAAGQHRMPLAILTASTTQAFPTPYQSTNRRHSHEVAALDDSDSQDTDLTPFVHHVEARIPQSPSIFGEGQVKHVPQILFPGTKWDVESYVDQVAALLRSDLGRYSKDQNAMGLIHGKNKADKLLVNQLLKDKGRLSYDWRIPLLQLQHAATFSAEMTVPKTIKRVYPSKAPQKNIRLAREVPRPTVWSEATLSQYAAEVVDSQLSQKNVPRSLRAFRSNEGSNVADITRILEDVFYAEATKKALTSEACNTALRFFYMYGMISRARALYIRMESLRMKPSTATFNIMLRGAAVSKDLHNFTFLLHKMLHRGFRPDDDTWVSLLIAVSSREVRAIIIHKMNECNVVQSLSTRKAVAELMIPHEVDYHIGSGYNPNTFVDHMDVRYGDQWLTTRAGNSLLNEICKNNRTIDCLGLLGQMEQRSFIPNEITMNTLLRQCIQRRTYRHSIEILKFFDHHFNIGPRDKAYATLFNLAWTSRRSLNLSRVVWRAACIDGHVNFQMRKHVFQSLLDHDSRKYSALENAAGMEVQSRSQKFRELAGYFVVGIKEPQAAELAGLGRALWASDLDSKRSSIKRAYWRIQSDVSTAKSCRLKVPLHELLRQALKLDLKWVSEGLWKNDNRTMILQDGIQVEVGTSEIKQSDVLGQKLRWIKVAR